MSITELYNRFPDVHPNIVLKTDLLRQGLQITTSARKEFNQMDDVLWRGFHLFSYDRGEKTVYKDKVPMGFHLPDGCCIQIRTNESSPYSLDFNDGEFFITENHDTIASRIYFDPKPKWYDMKFEDGNPVKFFDSRYPADWRHPYFLVTAGHHYKKMDFRNYTDRAEAGEAVRRIISARVSRRSERQAYEQAIRCRSWPRAGGPSAAASRL